MQIHAEEGNRSLQENSLQSDLILFIVSLVANDYPFLNLYSMWHGFCLPAGSECAPMCVSSGPCPALPVASVPE